MQRANNERYVSRAGYKLALASGKLDVGFSNKTVLDVGSSTGGFTDYALQHGAKRVVAVESGSDQLHPMLREDARIELHEKTDIRHFKTNHQFDLVVIDISFISLTKILPIVAKLSNPSTQIVAMFKPQFEAEDNQKNRGIIKNNTIRRQLIKDFEHWLKTHNFVIQSKVDSDVTGKKGNQERFYLLNIIK